MTTNKKQLDQVNEQIATMTKRREELLHSHNKAKNEQQGKERQLGQELLQGNHGKALVEEIANERTLIGGLQSAIEQADAAIEKLKAEKAKIEQEIAFENYAQQVQATGQKLFACIRFLDQANGTLAGTPLQSPVGYIENDEEKLIYNMQKQLEAIELFRRLIEFERIAPQFMADARKGK